MKKKRRLNKKIKSVLEVIGILSFGLLPILSGLYIMFFGYPF